MKKIYLLAAAATLFLGSCSLDINEDPNNPSKSVVTPDLVFPSSQNYIMNAVADQMFTNGGFFSQYFEQRPEQNQYNALSELNIDESSSQLDRVYRNLYTGALQDLDYIMKRNDVTNADRFACTVLRAYAFQLAVDNLNDVPYTEALKAEEGITTPKFDNGKDVYNGVLKELDDAEATLTSTDRISVKDAMLSGDVNAWKQFANALRLRMLLRLIDGGVDVASNTAKVQALVAANNFPTKDVTYDVFQDSEKEYNPWYGSYFALKANNFAAAYPLVAYYKATSDPRIDYAILPATSTGTYEGALPGSKSLYSAANIKNDKLSAINVSVAKTMPAYAFTLSELKFLVAEVQLRFNSNVAAAKTAYEEGIKADFTSRGVSSTALATYMANSHVDFNAQASTTDKLNAIYMQKWLALFMRDHMEAWSEIRRTDVPKLSSVSAQAILNNPTTYTAGELIAPAVNYRGNGNLAMRLPYPSYLRTQNAQNIPAVKTIADKVFWDIH